MTTDDIAGWVRDSCRAQGLPDLIRDPARFDAFGISEVRTDPLSVTVTFQAQRRLPFLGVLLGATEGIEISATATARAPYVD